MGLDRIVTSLWSKRICLLLLRVTTGFLIIWFGLAKVVNGQAPSALKTLPGLDVVPEAIIAILSGGIETTIGIFCVLGLWRKVTLPLQALINGFTALRVWWAIVDPFRWYITDVDRIVFNSHVFYPASITFAACLLLIAFRDQDKLAIDTLIDKRRL